MKNTTGIASPHLRYMYFLQYTRGMKKLLFGIFAHPDDEAFGPSASLYNEAQNSTDVHLVLVTDGENGINCDDSDDLATLRLKEWQRSGEIIGARSQIALHYPDGGLNNALYLRLASQIIEHVLKTIATYDQEVSVDFMTFEPSGITGHLDHIAVSQITTFAYARLKDKDIKNAIINTLKYYCLPISINPRYNASWIFMPSGRSQHEIDETFDYSHIKNKKLEIMRAHYSQRDDMKQVLSHQSKAGKDSFCDHFMHFKG